jgi:hypothetical protein
MFAERRSLTTVGIANRKKCSSTLNMPTCAYCGHHKTSRANLKRHVKQSLECHNAFMQHIQQFNVHAVDLDTSDEASSEPETEAIETSVDYSAEEFAFTINDGERPTPSLAAKDRSRQASVEEVVDEGDAVPSWNQGVGESRFVGPYLHPAGIPVDNDQSFTKFEKIYMAEGDKGPWGEFKTKGEWELAKWLLQNVGHNQIAKFLDLPIGRVHFLQPLNASNKGVG